MKTHRTKIWNFKKSLSADEQTRMINSFKDKYIKRVFKTHINIIEGKGDILIRLQLEFEPTEQYIENE